MFFVLGNIPNRKSQQEILDRWNAAGFCGLYDMFFLPAFDEHNNMGYGFIRFREDADARRFIQHFNGECLTVGSPKRLGISYSENQGQRKFRASKHYAMAQPTHFNQYGVALVSSHSR